MIEDGDKIAIGVSGGKDSVLLAYCLQKYRRYSPKKFEIIAIHLRMGFPNSDFSLIDEFLVNENIPCFQVETTIYPILLKQANADGSLKCSLCSKFKKALVIEKAKQENCNKVAFAHHGDDAIETMFLNAVYGGRVAVFRPKMYMSESKIEFIRPLIYLRESEIQAYVKQQNLPVIASSCPNDGHTQREEMKDFLVTLYEKFPPAYENFLKMLSNTAQVDLWEKQDY